MKKAMIITLGTGKDVENGIAFAMRQQNPDLVCLVYSPDSAKTIDLLRAKASFYTSEYLTLETTEINDVEKLHQIFCECIDRVMAAGYQPGEIVCDYTSGTKSMSAALVTASIARQVGNLSYVYGERDGQGRVISGTERVSPLEPRLIYTQQNIALFRQFFNKYQYASALSIFKSAPSHHRYLRDVEGHTTIAEAYHAWDKFHFEKAKTYFLAEPLETSMELCGLKAVFDEHKKKIKTLAHQAQVYSAFGETNKSVTEEKIKLLPHLDHSLTEDLLANAARRLDEGKFDDAVARLYRVLELYGQLEFIKRYHCATSRVPEGVLGQKTIEALKLEPDKGYYQLALLNTYTVLAHHHPLAAALLSDKQELLRLLTLRNGSILAHGLAPVEEQTAREMYNWVAKVLQLQPGSRFPQLQ